MALRKAVIELLSALVKSGSSTSIREIPDEYFLNDEERDAITWLKNYVREYRKFPHKKTFRRRFREQLIQVPEPLSYYVDEVRKRALYYQITQVAGELQDALIEKDPDAAVEAAKTILGINSRLSINGGGSVELADMVDVVSSDLMVDRWQGGVRGILSGWDYIDNLTGGWQNSDLITIVGRPSMGKTWMCLSAAHAAWSAGHSVLFVSMEMSAKQITRRFVGLHGGYNPDFIRKGIISSDQIPGLLGSIETIKNGIPFTIVAGNFKKSVDAVRALAEDRIPDLIVVDASYLLSPQKKRAGSTGRRETVSDVIEELGMLAKDLDRPVINSVQFNRNAVRQPSYHRRNEESQNPVAHLSLEKIGETDVIGQVSSIVLGLTSVEPPHDLTQRYLGFLKGREGEHGFCKINYGFSPPNFSCITETARSLAEINDDRPLNPNQLDEFRG